MSKQTDSVKKILERIKQITTLDRVEIVAASKTVPIETIKDVINNTTIKVAAENRVQEFLSKYDDSITWDFIGQLQSNKVKYIIDKVRLIHSVDRQKLLDVIDKEAKKVAKTQDILIQINTAKEQTKAGLYPEDVLNFADITQKYENIRLRGLMAVAPLEASSTELKKYFDTAYELYQQMKTKYDAIKYLSMGMSNDYQLSIKSGANLIRLGRAIFGERI